MKYRTVDGVTYYPRTSKEGKQYYPIVYFVGSIIGEQSFYLNTPQDSRSKARTIAVNHINAIK